MYDNQNNSMNEFNNNYGSMNQNSVNNVSMDNNSYNQSTNNNYNGTNNAMPTTCKLIITRKSSFVGMAVKFKIYIDDVLVAKIKNGETIELNVQSGNHVISCNKKNPVNVNIIDNTKIEVAVLASNNFGITSINGQSLDSNSGDNNIKKAKKGANALLIASILIPIVSFLMIVTISMYIKFWVYALLIGYGIVNINGLKNIQFESKNSYNAIFIKNVIAMVLSVIFLVLTLVIAV